MSVFLIIGIIIGIFSLFSGLIWFVRRNEKDFQKEKTQIIKGAVQAEAQVALVTHTGGIRQFGEVRQLGLRLVFKVNHPVRGVYKATSVWLVEELLIPQVQPRKIVSVLVNPDHPNKVYPNHSGMEFAEWIFRQV
jgi:hypothetical protein